jgi:hypothetical protein
LLFSLDTADKQQCENTGAATANVLTLKRSWKKGHQILEPIRSLLSNSIKNASTTICKLVLIFLPQFLYNRLYFSSPPKELSTTKRVGITTNLCKLLRLATSIVAPIIFFIAAENVSPV